MSSSDDPSGTDKQPGGMLTAVGGSHVGWTLESGEDKDGLGQWSWITLEGVKNLYVATAYRVQQENSEGTTTSFVQQKKLLRKKEAEIQNARKQWLIDLTKQIEQWKGKGEVIMMTDANSPVGDESFSQLLIEMEIYDLTGQQYGIIQINSHIRGTKK
eukprot:2550973-Ditylum_brightwellii.AAC.1